MDACPSRRTLPPILRAQVASLLLVGVVCGCSAATVPAEGARPGTRRIVTADDIATMPASMSVEDILERFFPSVYVRRRHEPGGAAGVQLMGLGVPLYIVDGVPLTRTGGTLGLNPRDIDTIEVRRDGAATAEYGLRGANGVILIRTKTGGR